MSLIVVFPTKIHLKESFKTKLNFEVGLKITLKSVIILCKWKLYKPWLVKRFWKRKFKSFTLFMHSIIKMFCFWNRFIFTKNKSKLKCHASHQVIYVFGSEYFFVDEEKREWESVCVSICVIKREREREKERKTHTKRRELDISTRIWKNEEIECKKS